MKERNVVLILVMVLIAACTVQAQVITKVVRAGGAEGDRDMIGEYFADSNSLPTEAGGLIAGNYCFSDRTYHWGTPPAQLNGVEYIRTFNSDKDNQSTVTYTVTTSVAARVFVGVDERFASQDGLVLQEIVDDVVANFASPGVFTDSGMGVLIQEDGNELLIFWADLAAGTYVFQGVPGNRNFMTIGAFETSFDPLPIVDAGPDRIVWDWPGGDQLNGSVDDADPLDGPAGTLTYSWTEDAGNPALGVINDIGALDSTLTLSVKGTYIFTLTASDDGGTTEVTDTVTVRLKVFGEDIQTVLLVSDVADEPGNSEEPLIAWLEGLDYVVDTSGMGRAFGEDEDPFDDGTEANDALLLALENANIIFFSSTVSDGEYDSNGSGPGWNAIPVPLLAQAAGLMEGQDHGESGDTRFGWILGDSRGGEDTDTMELVPGGESIQLWDWTGATTYPDAPGSIRTSQGYDISPGGTIKATNDGDQRIWWLDIPKGTDFDAGQDDPDPGQHGIAGERRVFFGQWQYDNYDGDGSTRGPGGGQAYWDSYMLPVYKEYLQDILFDLAPNPNYNPAPRVDAGPTQTIFADETMTVTLAGTITDEDPELGTPGTITSYWAKYGGPADVTFDPTTNATGDLNPTSTATFTAAGTYELMLQASDGDKDANGIVTIMVLNKELLGYWPFDVDPNDYSGNENHGTVLGIAAIDGDAAVGAGSVQLRNSSGDTDPNRILLGDAPELDIQSLPVAIFTVSAWIKTTNTSEQVIIQKGGHGDQVWILRTDGTEAALRTDDNDNGETAHGGNVTDGFWHFLLGVCDDEGIRIYVDGVFEDDDERGGGGYDLTPTSARPGFIGAGTDNDDTGSDATRGNGFDGLIDEVRVYNYALSEAEILALAAVGPIVATVDAGEDDPAFAWKAGRLLPLEGVVTDNGRLLGDDGDIEWTMESGPEGAVVTFGDATLAETTAKFSVAGVYVLKLTVKDGDAPGGEVADTVTIVAVPPTCAEVLADGFGMPGDIAGGGLLGDEPDCYVNLVDLVAILANWAECNVPQDDDCMWPF